MTSIAAHREPSGPAKTKTETKAEITNRAARAVIDAEVQSREAKTARLRRARIKKEKRMAASADAAKPVAPKTSRSQKTTSSFANRVAHKDTSI